MHQADVRAMALVAVLALSLWAPTQADPRADEAPEKAAIAKVIDASIGWFKTKDFDLLFTSLAEDPDFFIFHPDSKSTIRSGEEFRKYSALFRNPDVKYSRHAVRDLRIHLSRLADAAWYSAMLDDCSEYKGKESCWNDCRWTGVLEKQEGRWIIVQMHFSFAADKVAEEAAAKAKEGK